MSSGHMKRLVAPRSWNIARKERKWTTKPMPGKHGFYNCEKAKRLLGWVHEDHEH